VEFLPIQEEGSNALMWACCSFYDWEGVQNGMHVAGDAYSHDFLAAHFRPTWLLTFF